MTKSSTTCNQSDQTIRKKIAKFFKEEPKKLPSQKKAKYLQQTTFKTLKYLQQTMFWNLGKNVINLFKQKVTQKVTIILGYFTF